MKKRLEARVFGRVQLVMFRDFVQRNASQLSLTGCVWNEQDGSVRVIAEGEETSLLQLIKKLHRGSVLSRVESVEVEWKESSDGYEDFRIVRM